MSLHTLAQHLQSAGRGEDKVLVHMTPREVSGLQSLAMAHGGSLTINPETGLPEAGFLSGILPMVAGAALAATGVGAPMAALMVGGAGAVATGSLQKGLMMGLGAYGGAGLAAGLGAGAAGAAGAGSAASTIAAQNAAAQAATSASQLGQTMGAASNLGASTVLPAAAPATTMPGVVAGAGGTSTMAGGPISAVTQPAVVATGQVNPATGIPAGAQSVEAATSAFDRFKSIPGKAYELITGTGPEAEKAREDFLKANKPYLIAGGIGTLAMSRDEQRPRQEASNYTTFNPTYNRIAQSGGQYQAGPYTGTSERRYFADGGLADLPVARMSQQNMTGGNQNYPMAQIKPYGYAVPRNNPIAQDVIKPMDYQTVDPYTGEQKFADGGLASLVSMARGGFVSKLKAVPKPAEIKPKLQSTAALDKQIANLEKYSNVDQVKAVYADLQDQIKELQASKKERDAQAAQAAKDYNAAIAAINKEKAANMTSLNADFASRIKGLQADKGMNPKDRAAAIAEIQKEQKQAQTDLNNDFANRIKDRQADYKQYQTDLAAFNKDYGTQLAGLNKELGTAKNATTFATQYQTAVANRDKLIAANDEATRKAQDAYDVAMEKYQSYQDALADERQAWEDEVGSKATGIQAVRPQTTTTSLNNAARIAELQNQLASLPTGGYGAPNPQAAEIQKQIEALRSGATSSGYTPAYIKDPKTGKLIPSSDVPPITEFKPFTKVPGYDTTKRLMEEKDITAVFEDVAGRRPTSAEMDRFLGTQTTDAAIAQFAMNQPDVKQAVQYTDDDYIENFQYYIGRQPTVGELAAMKKAKLTNFNQMRNFLQQQPSYLKNLNAVAQQQFQLQQRSVSEQAAQEQQRATVPLSPEQVSTTYKDILGRNPSMEELRQYMGTKQTPEGLAGILKGSEEYLGTLTKPLVPTPQGAPQPVPQPNIAPIQFTRYAPGTVLEYTPQQQAAAGLGAIKTGVLPTPSGLQAPLTRGAVTLEGAMPLNPTFQEQMGLQTLATQAAQAAPPLKTGLRFEAQQPQAMFDPATLAALRAQQGTVPMAEGGYAGGGYHLGDYSDGGRLLKGPGDGVSDSIPASIGGRQPARLADGEFVIPARIVSELGNGSTDAGARKLYAMMDRIQRARRKSVGRDRVAVDSKAEKLLPV